MRDAFVRALTSLADSHPEIMLITADLGFGVLDGFARRFPAQFLNAGVAEQNMTGLATGLALEGRVVFTYSLGNFPSLRCLEQLRNDACYHHANVKVVTVGGGFSYGPVGASHHATEDLSILRALPGLTVLAPGDDWEAAEATLALCSYPGTAYLRLERCGAPSRPGPGELFRIGRARTLRDGSDATLVASGGILAEALLAADDLARDGVQCRVVSMHSLKPPDAGCLLRAATETAGIVTIEENTIDGGLGGCVAEILLEAGCAPGFFHRIGLPGCFSSEVGSQAYLRRFYGLDHTAIASAVLARLTLQPRSASDGLYTDLP